MNTYLPKDHDWVKTDPHAWAMLNIAEVMKSGLDDADKIAMVKDILTHISYAYFD